jgi:hypothetical protein
LQDTPKFTPKWNFWFENVTSGNPDPQEAIRSLFERVIQFSGVERRMSFLKTILLPQIYNASAVKLYNATCM